MAFNWIWSGKSLYWSCCISCASALRAASWNACSTLIASFALDSNDAMPPFMVHHCCSCFVVTFHNIQSISEISYKPIHHGVYRDLDKTAYMNLRHIMTLFHSVLLLEHYCVHNMSQVISSSGLSPGSRSLPQLHA